MATFKEYLTFTLDDEKFFENCHACINKLRRYVDFRAAVVLIVFGHPVNKTMLKISNVFPAQQFSAATVTLHFT